MAKVLVTGGAGFIGSHLAERLVQEENKVAVIDDFSLGKEKNLEKIKDRITIYRNSICDDLEDIFKKEKFDCVFHLAALPRVQFSILNPDKTHEANVNGTFNLLNCCKKFNVKRFVFSSSSSIYGNQEKMPLKEDFEPNPMSPYALHKLIGEYYCKLFNLLYGIETISLRYFNVYGPRQNPEGDYACLIPKFIKKIANKERPTIYGDGKQTRDFTYVEDVVEANILASGTKNQKCFGEVFNIGAGKNISVNQITQKIIELIGGYIKLIYGSPVIEPKHTLADIDKAKNILGWEPEYYLEMGLKETVSWFQNFG